MQAIEVRLLGRFWDSSIYNGTLFLFDRDGGMASYDWDRLIGSVELESEDARPLAMQFLTRGRTWYSPELRRLLGSAIMRNTTLSLLETLQRKPLVIGRKQLGAARKWSGAAPAFPHADIEMFGNVLYSASQEGVTRTPLTELDFGEDRILDAPALRIAASYGRVAVAAGSDGLFTLAATPTDWWDDEGLSSLATQQIADQYCASCNWAAYDITANSSINRGGFVAAFSQLDDDDRRESRGSRQARELVGTVPTEELFGRGDGFLTATSNQLLLVTSDGVASEGWNPHRRRAGHGMDYQYIKGKHAVPIARSLPSQVVDASVTVFGVIVELESSMLVLGSDGESRRFNEPIAWRTFPRSQRYPNQLHMIYEDHMRIYAWTHDYFLDRSERTTALNRPTEYRHGL